MPWYGWIAIAAIIIFGLTQAISILTGRPLTGSSSPEELEELRKRVKELEQARTAGELEPHLPTKAEENMAAEDRWRLDMLEARLEDLEKKNKPDAA